MLLITGVFLSSSVRGVVVLQNDWADRKNDGENKKHQCSEDA